MATYKLLHLCCLFDVFMARSKWLIKSISQFRMFKPAICNISGQKGLSRIKHAKPQVNPSREII